MGCKLLPKKHLGVNLASLQTKTHQIMYITPLPHCLSFEIQNNFYLVGEEGKAELRQRVVAKNAVRPSGKVNFNPVIAKLPGGCFLLMSKVLIVLQVSIQVVSSMGQ